MRVKFTDLEPEWVKYCPTGLYRSKEDGEQIDASNADGIMFLDPKEFDKKGGAVGCSSIVVWFRGKVPAEASPGPGRWELLDSNFETFTLNPSIDLTGGGQHPDYWHGWVQKGWAT